jgi:hypothetical protein
VRALLQTRAAPTAKDRHRADLVHGGRLWDWRGPAAGSPPPPVDR